MIDEAPPPGYGNPRLSLDVGQEVGRRQNTGDMVRRLDIGHPDGSTL